MQDTQGAHRARLKAIGCARRRGEGAKLKFRLSLQPRGVAGGSGTEASVARTSSGLFGAQASRAATMGGARRLAAAPSAFGSTSSFDLVSLAVLCLAWISNALAPRLGVRCAALPPARRMDRSVEPEVSRSFRDVEQASPCHARGQTLPPECLAGALLLSWLARDEAARSSPLPSARSLASLALTLCSACEPG